MSFNFLVSRFPSTRLARGAPAVCKIIFNSSAKCNAFVSAIRSTYTMVLHFDEPQDVVGHERFDIHWHVKTLSVIHVMQSKLQSYACSPTSRWVKIHTIAILIA